jgi:hypothetical protein
VSAEVERLTLSNGTVELEVLVDAGPRILRYARTGGRNAFHVVSAPEGPGFQLRGGHRLWVAPEDPERTYAPDDVPVAHGWNGDTLRLTAPPDARFGIEKGMALRLAATGSEVQVVHRLTNRSEAPQMLAAWALTVLAPGGCAVVPLPPVASHPGSAGRTAADFAPRMTLSLWPYTVWDDPRLTVGERFLQLRHTGSGSPTKLGLIQRAGWAGYWNDGLWFVKRFPHVEGAVYPDGGVNFETYTDARFLELESLSPLVTLAPGESVDHTETWTLEDEVVLDTILGPSP